VKHCHLNQHTISCFLYDDTAWAVENPVANDDATAYGQAVHESAIIECRAEPGLVDAPVVEFTA